MRLRSSVRAVPWLVPPATVGVALVAGAGLAAAATLTFGPVRVPDNPLAGTGACAALVARQQAAGSVNNPDAEVEPMIAVDPTNPQHMVGSMQQDRWNDGGSNGLTNVVSTDGGRTWSLATGQPRFTTCEGAAAGQPGAFDRTTDPWVSFSADGRVAYSIADSFNTGGPAFGGASAILISRSTDGGTTWQTPVTARSDASTQVLNDKESVTADPLIATNAYATWDQLVSPQSHANPSAFNHSIAFRGPSYFSKTTDKGLTWSTGRIIFDPGQKNQTIGNQIVVPSTGPARGVLIDGFDLITTKGGKCPIVGSRCKVDAETDTVAVIRSTDGGATWSAPIRIDTLDLAPVTLGTTPVRSSDELPEFATNPATGAVYAVWQDSRFSAAGHSKIAFSQSLDGGLTWSPTVRADQSPGDVQAFVPQIHATADGTVGLLYYDDQYATAAAPGVTDTWLATCAAACSTAGSWTPGGQTHLNSTSFDYTTAPDAGGVFLGDYDGLTAAGTTFTAFYGMSQPVATAGRSDIFASGAG